MALGIKKLSTSSFDLKLHLFYGFFLRFFLIMYGIHHDETQPVKFTDIDYHVFTDAARQVSIGNSPFDRHTYRYTPFISWLLLPNVLYNFIFGKILFSLLDCLSSKIIYEILFIDGYSPKVAGKCSLLWLYNPLVIAISTRGSCDSIMAVLVLTMAYFLKLRLPILSGIFLGLAVHFKLYPIIYTLPIYLSFTRNFKNASIWEKCWLNKPKFKFLAGLAVSFVFMTGIAYGLYREKYIEESFLYHVRRWDTRHNFSIYFYLLYLCEHCNPWVLSVCTFGPQMLVVAAFGFKYGSHIDLNFALFAQTVAFVTYNKVVTSQYFIWYLLLLPLVAPKVNVSKLKALFLFTLWVGAQASWLLPAYLLEFKGMNTFLIIWLESIALFCCNIGILMALIKGYASKKGVKAEASIRKNR